MHDGRGHRAVHRGDPAQRRARRHGEAEPQARAPGRAHLGAERRGRCARDGVPRGVGRPAVALRRGPRLPAAAQPPPVRPPDRQAQPGRRPGRRVVEGPPCPPQLASSQRAPAGGPTSRRKSMTQPALPSYSSGTSTVPLLGDTIGADLDRTAARVGDHEALVECATGRRFSYPEFVAEVDAVALGLDALGVVKGDRVGIWAPNCAEWAFVQYATAKLGAILVNINPAYRTHELAYVLEQAGIRSEEHTSELQSRQ